MSFHLVPTTTLSLVAAFLLAQLPSPAQDTAGRSSSITFRVTRFDPADRPSPKFQVGSGETKEEIEVPLTYIAGPFKSTLREGGFLDLWRNSTEKPEISIKIGPSEQNHLLLVFFPEGDTFRVMKVNTPPNVLKGGDRFIINTTPTEIGIKLGDAAPVVVPSAKSAVLAGPPGNKIVSLPVVINLKQDGKWQLASTEDWPCDPRFRKYLIAYMSPRSRQLVFHSLSELSE